VDCVATPDPNLHVTVVDRTLTHFDVIFLRLAIENSRLAKASNVDVHFFLAIPLVKPIGASI
jgi:hypothetical protein